MQGITISEARDKPAASDYSEMLLSALRCATLRARLDANEFQTIGIALRSRAITADDAMQWLSDSGLISQVIGDHEQQAA